MDTSQVCFDEEEKSNKVQQFSIKGRPRGALKQMCPASQFWLLPPLAKIVLHRMQNSGLTLWVVRLGTWCFLTELFIQGICFKGNPQSTSNCLGSLC